MDFYGEKLDRLEEEIDRLKEEGFEDPADFSQSRDASDSEE